MSGKTSRAEGGGKHATLTSGHRRYLTGFSEKTGNTEVKSRESIRSRIQETMFDLQLLFYSLETNDMRLAFEGGHGPRDGPVARAEPRVDSVDTWGRRVTGYENEWGYPQEGDLLSGYDGKSVFEAAIEHVLEQNPGVSKATPGMQRALVDTVAFLCRASEAGQLDVRKVIEQGVEKYHQRDGRVSWDCTLEYDHPGRNG
jgi:hypothetical protein